MRFPSVGGPSAFFGTTDPPSQKTPSTYRNITGPRLPGARARADTTTPPAFPLPIEHVPQEAEGLAAVLAVSLAPEPLEVREVVGHGAHSMKAAITSAATCGTMAFP